jgi:UDP-N-acetylglucosamine enolpyruvyl transferase
LNNRRRYLKFLVKDDFDHRSQQECIHRFTFCVTFRILSCSEFVIAKTKICKLEEFIVKMEELGLNVKIKQEKVTPERDTQQADLEKLLQSDLFGQNDEKPDTKNIEPSK